MGYYHYEVTDFLEDDAFKTWVFEPNYESDLFWKDFLMQYPERSEMISNARCILLELRNDLEQEFPSDEKVEHLLSIIKVRKEREGILARRMISKWVAIAISSAAMLLLMLNLFSRTIHDDNGSFTYRELISQSESPLVQIKNKTSKVQTIILPDSSSVVLQPASIISYPKNFKNNGKREVYLSGEAFFKVTKNPDRPFFVYANELVTKVLGTSFTIKAFDCAEEVEVAVKTGKVSVFARTDKDVKLNQSNSELGGVIITPNQKILFSREEIRIKKSLVEYPEIIASSVLPAPMLTFEDASVSQIFNNLEQTYGIDIVYDEELFGNCLLTASFSNENLYEKIDLICKGVEASFEVVDARVVISGRGCR